MLDIGGESTPARRACRSASTKSCDRVLPVLRRRVDARRARSRSTPPSRRSCAPRSTLGADIVNDIDALRAPGALDAVAAHPRCGVCLMHMHGEPRSMQQRARLRRRGRRGRGLPARARRGAARAPASRASASSLDPGIGFGKTRRAQPRAAAPPAGAARARPAAARRLVAQVDARRRHRPRASASGWPASVAAALAAVQRGARIVRVHDVAATVDALKVWRALESCRAIIGDAAVSPTTSDIHEQNLFRHRRHPRHGRPAADHARLHAAPRPRGRPRAEGERDAGRPC